MAPWVKLYVDLFRNPKVAKLPERDQVWYLKLMCYAGEHETDGLVEVRGVARANATQLRTIRSVFDRLSAAGLLDIAHDGDSAVIHNYPTRQATKDQLKAKRASVRNRVTRHRRNAVTDHAGNGVGNALRSRGSSVPKNRTELPSARVPEDDELWRDAASPEPSPLAQAPPPVGGDEPPRPTRPRRTNDDLVPAEVVAGRAMVAFERDRQRRRDAGRAGRNGTGSPEPAGSSP